MTQPIVMKFGGTSVRDAPSRAHAMQHIKRHFDNNQPVVVVVSAMGRSGEPYATDTLIRMLRDIGDPVNPRELDMIMSVGEVISSVYFAHLLTQNGMSAVALTGPQAGIQTDSNSGNAEIVGIDTSRIQSLLGQTQIPIVAGFQGADANGEILTLGRGGSDTSAVALGAYLDADCVEIYSDVNGIAQADPRIVPEVKFIDSLSAELVLAMAQEGSKVIHPRAVKASLATKTPIRMLNTFNEASGTLIRHDSTGGDPFIAIAHRDNLALVKLNEVLKIDDDTFIKVDDEQYLISQDAYFEQKIKPIRKHVAEVKERCATVSVIFSNSTAAASELPVDKLINRSGLYYRYLARSEQLPDTVQNLYDTYFRSSHTP